MKTKIGQILQLLVSLPLWSIGRAHTLEWFAFGTQRWEIPLRNGKTKIVSEYALHVQCPWRIRYQNKLIVASEDRYYPSGQDPYKEVPDFDWNKQGANQLDQRVSRFLDEHGTLPLIVDSVTVAEYGDITMVLNREYFLEIFVNNSVTDEEYWRFFEPHNDKEHLVFTNRGLGPK